MLKIIHFSARKITSWEHPRTQSEFENSYTFKMFLFQFINYYSSLIYTAFFKGRFFTYPGDVDSSKNTVAQMKTDMCEPGGCLYELCLMLVIYMIGRQLVSNTAELYWPKFKNWARKWLYNYRMKSIIGALTNGNAVDSSGGGGGIKAENALLKRWEADYQLEEIDRLHLFDEYIEMVIQYGFVTLFVAAFPLAPLLALINNIFEIRLDAYKYTTQMRRPLGQPVRDIGIWYGILEGMTYLSVVFNAFVIALTSDFIPKFVYLATEVTDDNYYTKNYTMAGYINSTLSIFNTSTWGSVMEGNFTGPRLYENGTVELPGQCYYLAYRELQDPANLGQMPDLTKTWWHVFAARLAFVAVFEVQ